MSSTKRAFVIPVHDEVAVVRTSVERLHAHLVAAIVGSLGGSVRLDRPSDGVGVAAVVDLPAV